MKTIWHLAIKDLRLLARDRGGAFFVIFFPVLMGLFFGLVMNGPSSGGSTNRIDLALVDEDQSRLSRRLAEILEGEGNVSLHPVDRTAAVDLVRRGQRKGLLRIPAGFGERAGVMWRAPAEIEIGMDPSRTAEAGMVEGFLLQSMGQITSEEMMNTSRMLPMLEEQQKLSRAALAADPVRQAMFETLFGSLRQVMGSVEALNSAAEPPATEPPATEPPASEPPASEPRGDGPAGQAASDPADVASDFVAPGAGMQLARITRLDVTREEEPGSLQAQTRLIRSRWDISFPQAMLWGVLGCAAGFAISLVRERTLGTLPRLQMAPIGKLSLLLGKALACFLAVLMVFAMMTLLGCGLGMRPGNTLMLAVAAVCTAIAFVGIMMTVSVLGRTEQGVSGAGWAINMVMAMLGGAMIPAMFMPGFLQQVGKLSPVRWAILSVEGAIWRNFSWSEQVWPFLILLATGAAGTAIGLAIWNRRPGN